MKRHKNRETEIKLRVTDVAALRRLLRRMGAHGGGRVYEHNILHDTSRRGLARSGRLLRLRCETPAKGGAVPSRVSGGRSRAWLTYKGPAGRTGRYKVREEIEVPVVRPEVLASVFGAIGLLPTFRYEKFRTRHSLPGFSGLHLDLDETPVGTFLELEGPKRQIDRAARRLGYSPADYITASYWGLYCDACRRLGRRPGNMLFKDRKI
jgi:adenylate cyclase class 2